MNRRRWPLAIVALSLLSAGCGQPDAGDDEILQAIESFKDFGDYSVHFNAVTTNQLEPAIASEYGIVRAGNRVLLNISVLRNQEIGIATAVTAGITASARNLTGQLRDIPVREIREGDAIYYIGETAIVDSESLIFTIEALPESATEPLRLSFQRQFFID